MKTILYLLLSIIYLNPTIGQIKLQNPSFEGTPQDATTPVSWHPCEYGSTPDILPGFWGVYNEASEGETYVGLITRPDGTFESIGQRTSEPLLSGECYSFSLDLAHSKTYTEYNKPLKLRIWGGTTKCQKSLLIGTTGFVEEEEWKTFTFKITPKVGQIINYIILEAYYKEEKFERKGNILIDNISVIEKCQRASL